MNEKKLSLLWVLLALVLALTACSKGGAEPEDSAGIAAAGEDDGQQEDQIEEWRAEQKIVVNGETYQFLLRAILSQEEDEPVTVRLDSDVQLTNTAVVLGTSDYGGMMGGNEVTVPSHDITLDLNGHTLTAEKGCAVFQVQDGYTLTVVDSSEAKGGRLSADGEAVVVEDGGTYVPLAD